MVRLIGRYQIQQLNNKGSLSTGVDEVIFRIQFIYELGFFFILNSINKVFLVLK